MSQVNCHNFRDSGVDPVLVVEGSANLLDGGADPIYLINFLRNPMKFKKFCSILGAHRERPPPP